MAQWILRHFHDGVLNHENGMGGEWDRIVLARDASLVLAGRLVPGLECVHSRECAWHLMAYEQKMGSGTLWRTAFPAASPDRSDRSGLQALISQKSSRPPHPSLRRSKYVLQ